MNQIYIILLCAFAAITAFALISALFGSGQQGRHGLEGIQSLKAQPGAFASAEEQGGSASHMKSRLRRFDVYRNMERALARAGWRLTPIEFGAIAVGAILLVSAIAWFWSQNPIVTAVGALLAAAGASISLEYARWLRLRKFEIALPEALDLMAASLRSGQGFQRALQVTAEDMPSPVKDEFSMAVQDISVGHTVEEALEAVWTRVPSYEMELITTAISIQLQVGGNLSEILQKIADTLRERARIRGEIATLTAEGKLSGILVFIIPIALFFWLKTSNPDYMAPLINTDIGRMMLLLAAISECIGMLIIWRMVSMEV